MEYHKLNQQLVIKPYPLPILGETIHQLEGFQCVNTLYINMGYFNKRLFPAGQYMPIIATEFGKFMYNRLPMRMCASVDIFQAKVEKLHGDIGGIKTYTNYILSLRK